MTREDLRSEMLAGIEKVLSFGRLVSHDGKVMLLSMKGVLAVDAPPANGFLDECLKTLPRGEE